MFRRLAELPIPISGFILGESNVFQASYSIRDHAQNLKRIISKTVVATATGELVKSPAQEVPAEIVASAFSPSGRVKVVLRESSNKKRFVETWVADRIEASAEVTDIHGSFYSDDYLASLSFSPSENTILYTAEANPPNKDASNMDRFRYTPSFGEGLYTRKRPTLFLFPWRQGLNDSVSLPTSADLRPRPLGLVNPPPIQVHLGQASFAGENKIVSVGYDVTGDSRILGVKGCFNRPASIWTLDVPAATRFEAEQVQTEELACTSTRVSSPDISSRSPRVHHSSQTVFYLSSALGGAHAACSSLHSLNLATGQSRTIVDTVWEPEGPTKFPGLYSDNLPQRPFLQISGKLYIVCHSIWRSRTTILLIDTDSGAVIDLTPDVEERSAQQLYSWSVLGTDGKEKMLCSRSSPTIPHELVLVKLDPQNPESPATIQVLDAPSLDSDIATALSTLSVSILEIPTRHPTETILFRSKAHASNPTSNDQAPLITVPHGGPHGTTTTAFSAATAALALEGYTLSLPNYTGSLGFGEKFVQALRGNCGSLDVDDCITSVRYLVEVGVATAGKGKQFIQGGSHGGFLTAHLIGQYPDIFSAAALRNPVVSIGELSHSDIPDWYFSEFALPYNPASPTNVITSEIYAHLYASSPISLVDNVKTKVLLLVGGSDLRVAPTQGVGYYHALKGRGKKVEMLWFEGEGHPLDGVEATRVGWEAVLDWFNSVRQE